MCYTSKKCYTWKKVQHLKQELLKTVKQDYLPWTQDFPKRSGKFNKILNIKTEFGKNNIL